MVQRGKKRVGVSRLVGSAHSYTSAGEALHINKLNMDRMRTRDEAQMKFAVTGDRHVTQTRTGTNFHKAVPQVIRPVQPHQIDSSMPGDNMASFSPKAGVTLVQNGQT